MKRVVIVAAILASTSLGILTHAASQDAPSAPATPPKPPQAAPSAPAAPSARPVRPAPPEPAVPAASANPPASFEQMKSLLGEWEGKTSDGHVGRATYKLVSSGTAIMETLNPTEAEDMITIYHPDGDRLMLTHYCASNNQPRMRTAAGSNDPTKLVFEYVDATNLGGSREGVMTGLTITFVDADHFSQTWTWRDKVGGTPTAETFQYTRKR